MPYTVQCRIYSKRTVNQLYNCSIVLGAAIKCKQFSEITVEIGTHSKIVKTTLNIFAVQVAVLIKMLLQKGFDHIVHGQNNTTGSMAGRRELYVCTQL